MAHPDADLVRTLAAHRNPEPTAVSCYLDVDPATVPTAHELASHVTSVANGMERAAEEVADALDHDGRTRLRAAVERIAAFLESELDRTGAAGLGVFASGETWHELRLPGHVEDSAHVGRTFLVSPLLEFAERDRDVILVAVGRDRGTIWQIRGGEVIELEDLSRDGQGQHDQGGWSQPRYQRARDREAEDHMRTVAGALARTIRQGSRELLVLAASEEQRGEFEELLEPHLREALLGWTAVEKQEEAEALRPEVGRLLDDRLERERAALLDRWREELGQRNGRATDTWSETMAAAWEGRVEAVLVDGRTEPAFECPLCGRAYADRGKCELHEATLEQALGGTLEAVARGTLVNGGVVRFAGEGELDATDGVAALLRYAVVPTA